LKLKSRKVDSRGEGKIKMQEQLRRNPEQFLAVALFDNTGHVVAFNDKWSQFTAGEAPFKIGSSLAEIATSLPNLATGLERVKEARQEFNSSNMHLSVEMLPLSLTAEADQSLLIVSVSPLPSSGDTAAKLRHDIKNRIGGLKLYVTFLKRKLGDQPELLDVVNKMSDSLDHMNLEANKIQF
jgi:nitrogen-specific signal transduction histidine kinase